MFYGFRKRKTKHCQDNSIFNCCLHLVYICHDEYLMICMNYYLTQDMLFIPHEAWWNKTFYHVDKRFLENKNGSIYHYIKSRTKKMLCRLKARQKNRRPSDHHFILYHHITLEGKVLHCHVFHNRLHSANRKIWLLSPKLIILFN